MSQLIIPKNYKALLSLQQTEIAIKKIKDFFLSSISTELRLRRVTAPLFVLKGLGMNDDLSGTERPVTFPIKDMAEAMTKDKKAEDGKVHFILPRAIGDVVVHDMTVEEAVAMF